MKISINFFCSLCLACVVLSINSTSEVFFSPDDHPTKRLIDLINLTKKRIYAAVYMLTDKQIAGALISAKKRGVDVKVIIDKVTADYEYGKAQMLSDGGVGVYIFCDEGKNSKNTALMHNKFAILDEKLWTGSFNWTKSANQKNQENVILTTNKTVCKRFEDHFEVLKKRCIACKATRNTTRRKSKDSYDSEKNIWEKLKDLIFQIPVSDLGKA